MPDESRERDEQDEGQDQLAMPSLTPEEALRGFLQVDPEKVKDRERCTCEEWPYKGGKPDPDLPGVLRDVELDRGAVDPDCPVHGALLREDDDA